MIIPISAENFQKGIETPFAPDQRASANSKRILLISGGNPEKLSQYRQLRNQGVNIVVLDAPDHWAKRCLESGLIEAFLDVNLAERDTLFDDIIKTIVDSGFLFDEVVTFSASTASLAARLAYAMGLRDSFGVVLN